MSRKIKRDRPGIALECVDLYLTYAIVETKKYYQQTYLGEIMSEDTNECESYKKMLDKYLEDQKDRNIQRVLSPLFKYQRFNHINREAEKKTKLDILFHRCQLSKLSKIEHELEEIKKNQQASPSNNI